MAEEKNGFTDRLNQCHDIQAFIFKAVTDGRVRFPAAAAGHGIDGKLLLEKGFTNAQLVLWSLKPPCTRTRGGPLPYWS
jgi:hypothetical protein